MPSATPLEKVPYLFGKGNQPFRTRCLTFSDRVRHPWRRGNRVKMALHPRGQTAGRVPPQPGAANGSPSPGGAGRGAGGRGAPTSPSTPQHPTGIVGEPETRPSATCLHSRPDLPLCEASKGIAAKPPPCRFCRFNNKPKPLQNLRLDKGKSAFYPPKPCP